MVSSKPKKGEEPSVSVTTVSPPETAAEPAVAPAEVASTSANEEEQYFKHLGGMFGIREDKPKYPLLQERQMLYFRLDQVTAAQVIELLETTGWSQTDAGTLMVKQFMLFSRKGVFQMLMNKQLFESNKPEDLKKIRDTLKPVALELSKVIETSIWSKYRHNLRPDLTASARNNGVPPT
jgi:hypothetical protein